ncbi:FAD:protein FMN transferase [Maribius pontilimi]|uniref:FAD:protein FMN transferase n=1 Tax=Palleronia pontilimi TaxID=1964209 RepID=A0A934IH27_9RHOB|nr:FAD:protein FMN transferase [Palleronia pontilimi]MBJ3761744.1 FAD:protein FMN transferase [Palleronia pontilimi]
MKRRRFLALSAAALCLPAAAARIEPVRWSGFALGAEVSMTLRAPRPVAEAAIAAALSDIDAVERAFSLYRPDSELVRLNTTGTLAPFPLFSELLDHVDRAHSLTGGVFDPTVQSAWADIAEGRAPDLTPLGWHKIARAPDAITLGPGQQLTFNGIAQGFATDRVRATLLAHGLGDILVDIGEFAASGGPWRLGIADPTHGLVARTTLTTGAIATTSAAPHLIDPRGRAPRHATVSIEAPDATLADALSTACLFLPPASIARICHRAGAGPAHVIDAQGRHRLL